MSTKAEKIEAQARAFKHSLTKGDNRHLIGPAELEPLLSLAEKAADNRCVTCRHWNECPTIATNLVGFCLQITRAEAGQRCERSKSAIGAITESHFGCIHHERKEEA